MRLYQQHNIAYARQVRRSTTDNSNRNTMTWRQCVYISNQYALLCMHSSCAGYMECDLYILVFTTFIPTTCSCLCWPNTWNLFPQQHLPTSISIGTIPSATPWYLAVGGVGSGHTLFCTYTVVSTFWHLDSFSPAYTLISIITCDFPQQHLCT